MATNNNIEIPATHNVISAHCAQTLTTVTFVAHGIYHRARRFWREDMPTSGKIEIYTIPSFPGAEHTMCTELGWYASTFNEDFFRYADRLNPSSVDAIAIELIAAAIAATAPDELGADQSARFAAMELDIAA